MFWHFIARWAANLIAIYLTAQFIPGVSVLGWKAALLGSLVFTIFCFLVRPILLLLTLPINILTLGLFTIVVSGIVFWLSSLIVPGFVVQGPMGVLLGAFCVGLINAILFSLFK